MWELDAEYISGGRRSTAQDLDALDTAATVVSLVIFAIALYEAVQITRIIGRVPRFWLFFLAAISFLILRRVLILGAAAFSISVPGYWATLDNDGTPIIFSALLVLWVYDMRKSFQQGSPRKVPELVPPEKA